MKTTQEHKVMWWRVPGEGTSSGRVVKGGGLSEKVTFEPRLKNKKAQPCQEQKEELCRQREQQVPRRALVCRG